LEGEGLHQKTVSAISEDLKRERSSICTIWIDLEISSTCKSHAGPNKTLIALLSGIGPISLWTSGNLKLLIFSDS
jgi:hypothetical protein